MNEKENLMHKKGYAKGDKINFYYLPDEHRMQYAKPARYKKHVKLFPESELEALKKENEELKKKVEKAKITQSDKEQIEGEFAEAERSLVNLRPDGENPDAENIYEILLIWKDNLTQTDK